MKILRSEQIREVDAYTIEHEPIASIDLMERASKACADWIAGFFDEKRPVKIFSGMGNNGGDGLAIGCLLERENFDVKVFAIRHSDKTSEDFAINYKRLQKSKNVEVADVNEGDDLPEITENDLVIDAMLGSGLSKPVRGFIADVVQHINSAEGTVTSVDVPTGLFGEDNSENNPKTIIRADFTLTFQLPRLSFMFAENTAFTGQWQVLDIGLDKDFIEKQSTDFHYLTQENIQPLLKGRSTFSHKGTFGHALLLSGSHGSMGAALMAGEACLRSGAGLLTAYIPKCGYEIYQSSLKEAMVKTGEEENFIASAPDLAGYDAVGIGPGIGQEEDTAKVLKLTIQNTGSATVFDADALNLLGENKTWISFLPKNCILTPHPKEFERMFGKCDDGYSRMMKQKEMAKKHGIFIVLKGAHTSIACPDGQVFFNSTGNPGMATGGSGDVLTGIILGLLAQGYSSGHAALIGVYLHGVAGDIAAEKWGQEAMIAGDIIQELGEAYKAVRQ